MDTAGRWQWAELFDDVIYNDNKDGKMLRQMKDVLNSIAQMTVLTESHVAFCSDVSSETDGFSKAVIYDHDEKKIVANFKSKEHRQLTFYRTDNPDLFVIAQCKKPAGEFGIDSALLISSRNFQAKEEFSWENDNIFSDSDNNCVYIDNPLRSRSTQFPCLSLNIEFQNFGQQTARFTIYHHYTHQKIRGIALKITNFYNINPIGGIVYYKPARVYLKSACTFEDKLIIGYCRDEENKISNTFWRTKFSLIILDTHLKKQRTTNVKHIITRLHYIPEKKLIIGWATDDKNILYIFNDKLKYQIIRTPSPISDIAIFKDGQSKILFENAKMEFLEKFINNDYFKKYVEEIENSIKTGIPTDLTSMIVDYSFSGNIYSLLHSKPQSDKHTKSVSRLIKHRLSR